MVKKRSSTGKQQNDDVPWSDLNNDVLLLIMMRGVVDFLVFSGVCKSWRSLALSNWKRFMVSKPPMFARISPSSMSMCISPIFSYKKTLCITDFEGRKFKTILPHCVGRKCVGLTCGYLILFGKKTKDFWLVNPITKHQLCFPRVPSTVCVYPCLRLRAIFFFSPSISWWVLVMVIRFTNAVWFSIAGEGAWNHVSSPLLIRDIHVFKGKIYTLNNSEIVRGGYQLCELRLNPHPKLVLLETKNFLKRRSLPMFVSSGENLYVLDYSGNGYSFHELDFGQMKWVLCENTKEEYGFFYSSKHITAFKAESRANPWLEYGRHVGSGNGCKARFFAEKMWYFPHDCVNVNLIHK
ncbi:uncharacterized protein LOC111879983 [Lactuca sativa]|uniref:uncharacterized protein LOC111879983 n=1 Tax=Lactuca sativa TaxID=4236 RepID=UPI000CA70AEE|nr:uncharacterized protein LOC111879983 [Lactuca sativa]